MNTHDIDTGLPYVAFCRVSDIDPHESHHRQLGVSADTRLYTEDQVRAAIEADRQRRGEPVELQGVSEALSNGDGFWRSCTGCHETNEGHATGSYSETLQCHLGIGCSECGGIGAIWDDTDYEAMADYLERDMGAPQPAEPTVKESLTVAEPVRVPRIPDGFRLVNEDELIELSDSILGNYYRGQDWERERITKMLEAAPKFGEEE